MNYIPQLEEEDPLDLSEFVKLSEKPVEKDFYYSIGVDSEGFTDGCAGIEPQMLGHFTLVKEVEYDEDV